MKFVGYPLYTLVVYSLCFLTFDISYASESSESESISYSESDSSELLPAQLENPANDATIVHSRLTIRSKKDQLIFGSLYLSLAIAASIALYLMVPKMVESKNKEETSTIESFDELENELLEWFTTDPLWKEKASRDSFKSDFDHFKKNEYSIIFSEEKDTTLMPKDDMMVKKFKQDFWKDYEKMLPPYFYYNQFQIGRFVLLLIENALLGVINYQGKSFFNFESGLTGRLKFDYGRCRKVIHEYKANMNQEQKELLEKAINMVSNYERYYNRVMDYKEKHCSEIEQRRHLALKPNYEIVAALEQQK